ncbi:MAG: 4-hydroxy-3-methylbut-2-enyl diphosphate reductase [Candidatus Shapirobacteria bacterium]|nr:4-hydroxy-3-methylbut-2-enyl diphosphate reductase [Candidatus Shapirobacteria bacterium]
MANIIIAQPHGFCFGVSRAIEITQKTAKSSKKPVFMLGELVHNQHVADWLESDLKIKTVQSLEEIPPGSIVIIRAHGAAPSVFQQARDKGLEIVDASCPLVLKSHQIVKDLSAQKKDIIFLCNKIDHDETIGVVGEAHDFVIPITLTDIFDLKIKNPKDTVIITQTTLSTIETKKALDFIKNKYPDITILPHICQATTDRQNAIIKLARRHKFVIIVGSPTSANSNSLKSVAESSGAQSYIVDDASELKREWFTPNQKNIAISSGASTPEDVLDQVVKKIKEFTHQ